MELLMDQHNFSSNLQNISSFCFIKKGYFVYPFSVGKFCSYISLWFSLVYKSNKAFEFTPLLNRIFIVSPIDGLNVSMVSPDF